MKKSIFFIGIVGIVMITSCIHSYSIKTRDLPNAKVIDKTEACIKGDQINHCFALRVLNYNGKKYLELRHNLYGYFGYPTEARLYIKELCDLSKKGYCEVKEAWKLIDRKGVAYISLLINTSSGEITPFFYPYPEWYYKGSASKGKTIYIKAKGMDIYERNKTSGCLFLYEGYKACFYIIPNRRTESIKVGLKVYYEEEPFAKKLKLIAQDEGKWLKLGTYLPK